APGPRARPDRPPALAALGRYDLDARTVEETLGSVLKYHEDFAAVRDEGLAARVEEARSVAAGAGWGGVRTPCRHVRSDPARGGARGRARTHLRRADRARLPGHPQP